MYLLTNRLGLDKRIKIDTLHYSKAHTTEIREMVNTGMPGLPVTTAPAILPDGSVELGDGARMTSTDLDLKFFYPMDVDGAYGAMEAMGDLVSTPYACTMAYIHMRGAISAMRDSTIWPCSAYIQDVAIIRAIFRMPHRGVSGPSVGWARGGGLDFRYQRPHHRVQRFQVRHALRHALLVSAVLMGTEC